MKRHPFTVVLVTWDGLETERLATFAAEGDAYVYGREVAARPAFGDKWACVETRDAAGRRVHAWPIAANVKPTSADKCRSCAVCLRALGRSEAQAWAEARICVSGSNKCAHCVGRARALVAGDTAGAMFVPPPVEIGDADGSSLCGGRAGGCDCEPPAGGR